MVVLGFDDGVDCGHGHVDGLMGEEGFAHVIDDALRYQRTYGIVEHEVDLLFALIGMDGREAGVISFLAAFQDFLYFGPAIAEHDVFHVGHIVGVRHDGNLIDVGIAFEGVDGMLDDPFCRPP